MGKISYEYYDYFKVNQKVKLCSFIQFWVPTGLIWLGARRKCKCCGHLNSCFSLSGLSIYLSKAVYRMETRT